MGKYSSNTVQQDLINYDGSTLLPNVLISNIYDASDNNGFGAIKEIFNLDAENNPISIAYSTQQKQVTFALNYDTDQFNITNSQLHISYDKGGNTTPVYFNNGQVKECESVAAKYMSSSSEITINSIPFISKSTANDNLYYNEFNYLTPNAEAEGKVLTCSNGIFNWQKQTTNGITLKNQSSGTTYYILGYDASSDVDSTITKAYWGYAGNNLGVFFKDNTLYQTSDETLKTFISDVDVNLDNLKSIKKGEFYWNDDPEKTIHIGVTAQSLEALYPQLVTDNNGVKAVAYNKLGVISLAAVDKLYERIQSLEKEIHDLKKELKK